MSFPTTQTDYTPFRSAVCQPAQATDSLMWEILANNGKWEWFIIGHDARAQWTPPPYAIAAFVKRLLSL